MDNGLHSRVDRPWGNYTVLCKETGFCVKRIEVNPKQRLSLQKHTRRLEKWTVVEGQGLARVNDEEKTVNKGDNVEIAIGDIHRMTNPTENPMVFIEVSFGDYIEEDDIIRLEDDYNRC